MRGLELTQSFADSSFGKETACRVAQMVKRLPTMRETWVQSLGHEDPLEKEMAPHSSTLAWKIPWTEGPGRQQSMGSQSQTRLSNFTLFAVQEDSGSIPGSGRSAGEGIGYTLPYTWASLVAQLVKNPPAMQETWV